MKSPQEELEHSMVYAGRQRAERMMASNEEGGRAASNPYASPIFRRFIQPLADVIQADLTAKRPGRRQAHVALLAGLDTQVVAFVACRAILAILLTSTRDADETSGGNIRTIALTVGRAVYNELIMSQFENINPALYHHMVRDFSRKLTKSERHRIRVLRDQAQKNNIALVEWGNGARDQVGVYLVSVMEQLGFVELQYFEDTYRDKRRMGHNVMLSSEVLSIISRLKEHVAETTPMTWPCIEVPKPWLKMSGGGWHTKAMQKTAPFCILRGWTPDTYIRKNDMPVVRSAINHLQSVAWKINGRMLDTVREVAKRFDMEEIICQGERAKPQKPTWLGAKEDKTQMTEQQQHEFVVWKRSMAGWYTDMKLRGIKAGRFFVATSTAERFRAYPSIYFVWQADFRGRLYPQSQGLSPQGSDLQKALLQFGEGKPLNSESAVKWFHIQGANKFGFDKATQAERVQWVVDRHDMILGFAHDPIRNNEWQEADSPLQFLAWCFEYGDWVADPVNFVSRQPISMDGSCNGLQNFSAMLRDEIGGQATNLTANQVMEDIYRKVAEAATARLQALEDDAEGYRSRWLAHGISRTVVKRAVMTTPYGVTQQSAIDYVVADYMKHGLSPEFEKSEWHKAARYLVSNGVWPAIGDVVVKARAAMDWLRKAAGEVMKTGAEEIQWVTPSGFVATQQYFEKEVTQIRSHLFGTYKLMVATTTDEPSKSKHKSSMAPNFVHSMDAAHLHLTTAAAADAGINSLAMIHDDYGTHAADAEALYHLIREQFVEMYTKNDPLAEFAARHKIVAPLPEKGTLDLNEVLRSPFFFT